MDHGARNRNDQVVPKLTRDHDEQALKALGEAIRALRIEREISQERLALLADVDRSYVGRIERGENQVAVLTLIRLGAALDMTVAEIMIAAAL